jgi:hypothetical protein
VKFHLTKRGQRCKAAKPRAIKSYFYNVISKIFGEFGIVDWMGLGSLPTAAAGPVWRVNSRKQNVIDPYPSVISRPQ